MPLALASFPRSIVVGLALGIGLVLAGSAHAYDGAVCRTPNHGGPIVCSKPGPPAPPAPVPTCPDGYLLDPYRTQGQMCIPIPSQEPQAPTDPPGGNDSIAAGGSASSNVSPGPVAAYVPFRPVPEPAPGDVFGIVTEQGPAAALDTIGLQRQDGPDALFWFQRSTGAWWLVVQSIELPDCILSGSFTPYQNLTAIDLDADGNDDLLGHDPITGLVFRAYVRSLQGCRP
ncbi:MAG: hypothetical protein GEV06_25495 [Luteitalea sp.]|nr:hypothetical protein [Luteitalea sp.]